MSILDAVKEAEEKGLQIKQTAAEQAKEIIRAAEDEARKISEEKMRLAGEECDSILLQAQKESDQAVNVFLQEARQKDLQMQAEARRNIPKAVRYIVERIEQA
ncbi:MAG: hypothetical protein ACYCX2_02980 [Christensenellales bacterium]